MTVPVAGYVPAETGVPPTEYCTPVTDGIVYVSFAVPDTSVQVGSVALTSVMSVNTRVNCDAPDRTYPGWAVAVTTTVPEPG